MIWNAVKLWSGLGGVGQLSERWLKGGCVCAALKWCLTLCDPVAHGLPGFSVLGIPSPKGGCTRWLNIPVCLCAKLLQLCPTLCDLIDCSPPGSSVHGILQARKLEWVAMPSSRGPSQPRNPHRLCLLHWQVGSLPLAPPGKPCLNIPMIWILGNFKYSSFSTFSFSVHFF